MSFAKVTLLGNLGRDPELRYTQNGNPVCSFTMATSEKRRDSQGEMRETTTWWRVTVWGKMAEVCNQYLAKGRQTCIEGVPFLSTWTDREGAERQTLEVRATDIHFVQDGNREDRGEQGSRSSKKESQPKAKPKPISLVDYEDHPDDNDVPF
jgi:single-strand DNA-binding protein